MAKSIRRLPPELLAEMHKCLPLAEAIYVLLNVSQAIFLNNSSRMHRNIQRLRSSLNEYIDTLVNDEEKTDYKLVIFDNLKWKQHFDAFLRYGTWMTSKENIFLHGNLFGMPENFVENLLLHLANSRNSIKMMLQRAELNFERATFRIPTILKQLLNEDLYRIGGRILSGSVKIENGDGQILHIYDGKLLHIEQDNEREYELILIVMNKMDRNLWVINMIVDHSKKFIRHFKYSRWLMLMEYLHLNEICHFSNELFYQNGNILEAKNDFYWIYMLELFLCRGVNFTQIRHFKIKNPHCVIDLPKDYVDFLLMYISNTKHPEEFLESIDINLGNDYSSLLIDRIWKICRKGIPEYGNIMNLENGTLHILSAKTAISKNKWLKAIFGRPKKCELEFTLANLATNGAYIFDVNIEFGKGGNKQIVGIKIQKRKVNNDLPMMVVEGAFAIPLIETTYHEIVEKLMTEIDMYGMKK